jgi:predicted metal-dependent HD superfamily phosphohydrolase
VSDPLSELTPTPEGIKLSREMALDIRARYEQPERFYHTFDHVVEVLRHFRNVAEKGPGWQHPQQVFCAILYHDVIYDYGAKDNEERSAALALEELPRWLPDVNLDLEWIARLIRLTAKHGKIEPDHIHTEEALFLDCDMAILGSCPERFEQYEQQIEREYTQVYPKPLYRLGRRKFLKSLQKSPRIYLSEYFHQHFEAPARDNLRRALSIF